MSKNPRFSAIDVATPGVFELKDSVLEVTGTAGSLAAYLVEEPLEHLSSLDREGAGNTDCLL